MLTELTKFFFTALTSDPTIAQYFTGKSEWVFFNMASPEADFPYIVHTVIEGDYGEHSQVTGEWRLSIYTAEPRTQLNQHISGLIKRKFNNTFWKTDYLPYVNLSIAQGGTFVDTGNNNIKRYDFMFNIRYARDF